MLLDYIGGWGCLRKKPLTLCIINTACSPSARQRVLSYRWQSKAGEERLLSVFLSRCPSLAVGRAARQWSLSWNDGRE